MKRTVVALLLSAWAAAGWSAGGGLDLLTARIDIEDTASLQRGARLYVNYCLGCHSCPSCATTAWGATSASTTSR